MNVLVIPEDFRKDQYMLKPIIEAMLNSLERRARVTVCQNPLLGGIDQALNWDRIASIIDQYKYRTDLFLLCVDRDDVPTRRQTLDNIERQAANILPNGRMLLAENAWQEIEVWVLAGHDMLAGWRWADIRIERDPKERYFLPFAEQRGLLDEPGQGRKTLAEEAAGQYTTRIRRLCPEVADLENRIL